MNNEKQTIDLTPTWSESVNICLALLEAGSAEGKKNAILELRKMATVADSWTEHCDNNVRSYLDCSTCHITEEDNDFLNLNLKIESLIVRGQGHPYGWWIHVPEPEKINIMEVSDNIKAILSKASKLGCYWVNLDRDGEEHSDLNTFNW